MKLIFFGTSEIAVLPLQALAASRHDVLAVVTRPDTKKGRGLRLSASPVKIAAERLGLQLYQPRDLNSVQARRFLEGLKADLFVVISYGLILPRDVLEIPRLYCINLHPSLLPKYRGAAPVNWAIIEGEKTTGVSVFRLTEEMDAGDIILQQVLTIDSKDNAQTLNKKLSGLGSKVLLRALDVIASDKVKFIPQEHCQASYAPRLKKEQGNIDWNLPAARIVNLIRGLGPWPGAFTFLGGRRLKIWEAHWSKENHPGFKPGEILLKGGFKVQTAEGSVVIETLQPAGKCRMRSDECLSGYRLKDGQRLTNKQGL